mmetsp:Transcript_73572/g.206572  ORF Transcript_73572/g.206572 Transcript_73572/m.206572 type:complete len:224 (-) Transcript_73572:443-1114(-)
MILRTTSSSPLGTRSSMWMANSTGNMCRSNIKSSNGLAEASTGPKSFKRRMMRGHWMTLPVSRCCNNIASARICNLFSDGVPVTASMILWRTTCKAMRDLAVIMVYGMARIVTTRSKWGSSMARAMARSISDTGRVTRIQSARPTPLSSVASTSSIPCGVSFSDTVHSILMVIKRTEKYPGVESVHSNICRAARTMAMRPWGSAENRETNVKQRLPTSKKSPG